MTQANTITKSESNKVKANIFYQVEMPQPSQHLFEVTLQINNWQDNILDLKMPVWTPGSYLVREYAQHIQDFRAEDGSDREDLPYSKIGKNHWQIKTENSSQIIVQYRVFANELTVRTNHLDNTHGYFNGAALFMFVPQLIKNQIVLTIKPPQQDWQVTTTLSPVTGKLNTFTAKDFDTLVDTPVEIGRQKIYDFEVQGKPHQLAIYGEGNINHKKVIKDTIKVIETEAKIFGGLPYDKYLFLLHLSGSGFGGLEHKDSCSLIYSRWGFRDKDKYNRFMQLVTHEFFHLWNVKRIRPKALEKFDYERENYTPSLWFSEGTTSYYDTLLPLRAGIYDRKKFLKNISQDITRYLSTPGRKVQPLGESSFDAWIKLYRRNANSDNNQISYYLKGELVSLMLDLLIREKHQNKRSLDDVMLLMWENFGRDEIGFTEQQLKQTIEKVAEEDLTEFFHLYLETTTELPLDKYFDPFGLKIKSIKEDNCPPYLGIKLKSDNGKAIVTFVDIDSDAKIAGIDPKDELLAINGIKITAESLKDRLRNFRSGDSIDISFFHDDLLITKNITLTEPQPTRYELVYQENISDIQQQNLSGWLG